MRQLMQQAQQMQEQLAKAQEELAEKTYEGTAGGGVVKAMVKGSGRLSVVFDPSVLDPDDPELVGDLVVAAVNAAMDDDGERCQLGHGRPHRRHGPRGLLG